VECGLVLAGFGAMARWARRNRAALDARDWCECARFTMRVIPSRQPAPTRPVRAELDHHAANLAPPGLKKASRSTGPASKAYQRTTVDRRPSRRRHSLLRAYDDPDPDA
jgi:hypothetical protein